MNTIQKTEIINRLAMGEPSTTIALDYDCTSGNVRAIKRKNFALVQQQSEKLLQSLPDIITLVTQNIRTNKSVSEKISHEYENYEPKDLISLKKIYDKSIDNVLRSVGIYPSQSPSIVFNNVDNRIQVNNQLHPVITKIMSTAMLDSIDIDTIDIDDGDLV